ncbi:unnamed protein product [Zymoseptoria tritici ST99CH_3D7]|uniref:Uncharacterized protein n=1 Tax=Zymoseptoria tritici (strain ST99CH_3D7) TaxID=1276538 RepID=A0A1X7S9B5_ZYMT9|nr:unnamed protein product [Zymoseptoria tritici ST99CH_3D7]
MSARTIEYIWKVARPRDEAIARALMYAAYQTAVQTDPDTTQVLIRSYVHTSTKTRGMHRPDDPHVTISLKNSATAQQQKHQTSHGYTNDVRSFNVVKVVPSDYIKDDRVAKAWPARMATNPKDTFAGEPGLLGPNDTKNSFITWPSEETGE